MNVNKINVAVIGAAGRMGKRLVSLILESDDLHLSGAIEANSHPSIGLDAGLVAGAKKANVQITENLNEILKNTHSIIDFSTGNTLEIASLATANNISCVIGTTGLNATTKEKLSDLAKNGAKIVLSSNMSIGVNILFKLARDLAKLLNDDYDIEIIETHHKYKKDAPSGTALSIAEEICKAKNLSQSEYCIYGRHGIVGPRPKKQIAIHAIRAGDVIGEHTIIFATEGERIEITHKASNRDAFAKGALQAVRFLQSAPPGLYSMQDVLGIK